ncbi:MAG TPA: DsrE/DsrF/DrsH-like family protein [Candidatus Dormibacteraeota bacterium]|nr:DsrE/DsrF/DrsH-like family protein [Candidatus Dormibacteraeota bacterium]
MEEQDKPLSLVLFSGTDDKLNAAAVLTVGAAAMGRPVNVFLQYYALDAFRAARIHGDHALSPEATAEQAPIVRAHPGQHWSELLRQAKDVGDVSIQACALSMDMFHLTRADLDPLVDGVEGVAAFMASAADGQVVFV